MKELLMATEREDTEDSDEDYRRRAKRRRRVEDEEDDDEVYDRRPAKGGGIIPYRNGMALASYYCGVFSLIPCLWGTVSLLAIIFGILGLNKAKANPQLGGKGHSITGIVLGSITIALLLAGIVSLYFLR
jgi:hypothetical protein